MFGCADIVQTGPPEAAMLQYVMHLLAVEDIEGLPPGGGINAKWVCHCLYIMWLVGGGSVAEWLACWTQAQKGLGSNRSHDAVG